MSRGNKLPYYKQAKINCGLIFLTSFGALVKTTGESQPFNPTGSNPHGLFKHEVEIIDEEREPGVGHKLGARFFIDLDIYTFCAWKSSPKISTGLKFRSPHGLLVETTGNSILNRGIFYLHEFKVLEGLDAGNVWFGDLDRHTPV